MAERRVSKVSKLSDESLIYFFLKHFYGQENKLP